jgi:ribosome maturation factor RimP
VGDELWDLLASTVAPMGLELVDAEVRPGLVRVVVDAPGGAGLEAIADATRAVSGALDRHDPLPGQRYSLEVTSPGVERPLRTPRHFERAVGEQVTVRLVAGGPGERRVTGALLAADDDGFELGQEDGERRRFGYAEVERARTVFEWGPASSGAGAPARRAPRGGRRADKTKKVTTP